MPGRDACEIEIHGECFVPLPRPARISRSAIVDVVLTPIGDSPFGGAILRVSTAARTVEFDLAPRRDGRFSILLPSGPLTGIFLAAPPGSPRQLISIQLRPLSSLRLAARALRIDPAEALSALYWKLRGFRVRARNRLKRLLTTLEGSDANEWLARHATSWRSETQSIYERQAKAPELPRIAVLSASPALPTGIFHKPDPFAAFTRCAPGIALPDYPNLSLCALSRTLANTPAGAQAGSASMLTPRELLHRLATVEADWIIFLREGDRLVEGALWRIADAAARQPVTQLLYGDQILHDTELGLRSPFLTPEWNEPYLIAMSYIGSIAIRKAALAEALQQLPDRPATTDVLIDCIAIAVAKTATGDSRGVIGRIPHLLSTACQVHHHGRSSPDARARRASAIGSLLASNELRIELDPSGWPRPCYLPPRDPPLVSIIVPTRDRLDLLQPCIEGLCERTRYNPIEIIIVDNGSQDRQTHAYFASLKSDNRVRVLDASGPFNFSAINNRAARTAQGRVLAFLNNDIEVTDPSWLCELVSPALRPYVGAVGCRLDYPAGPIQHGGVIIGLNGLAGHAHRFFDPDHPGYMRRLQSTQYMSAVTAACMVVEKRKFLDAGGFDEDAFPIALNDVDLCLKLQSGGLRNLYVPHARLIHKESASRARDTSQRRRSGYDRECRHFQERWAHIIEADPSYHPGLTRTAEDFSLA